MKWKRHSAASAAHEDRVLPARCADLHKISADSRRTFGNRVTESLESRIRAVVERISREPLSAPEVEQRPGLHVVPLIRYPFKIFYRIIDERVRILHIRHTARRPWRGGM